MNLTIIIPAYNEEAYLPSTLGAVRIAAAHLQAQTAADIEIIVVDNNSTDGTAEVARRHGATVVEERVQGISRARNTGARSARGDVLVFVDADVIMPRSALLEIHAVMSDPASVGGGFDVDYKPKRRTVGLYLRIWRALSRLTDRDHRKTSRTSHFCAAKLAREAQRNRDSRFPTRQTRSKPPLIPP